MTEKRRALAAGAPEARRESAWRIADRQHGVITRRQLLDLGYSSEGVDHRRERGRLHPRARGVYALGRPELSRLGEMMVAILACGHDAVVSHETAAELWSIRRPEPGPIEVSLPGGRAPARPGLRAHVRTRLEHPDTTTHRGVPAASVALVLVDLAARLSLRELEAAVNAADNRDLMQPERLRQALERHAGVPGVRALRALLDRDAFRLTDSELERMFLAIVETAGLAIPVTQRLLGGHRVDFVWPDVGLVVETDSLRYHRTPITQRRDAKRDHDHLLAGRESIRFTHFQIAHERAHVIETLVAAWRRAALLRNGRRIHRARTR